MSLSDKIMGTDEKSKLKFYSENDVKQAVKELKEYFSVDKDLEGDNAILDRIVEKVVQKKVDEIFGEKLTQLTGSEVGGK